MLVQRSGRQRGDTLIEVLFSITIFSMIMIGAVMLMNQGSAAARRALEISIVRQQIDGQAETLRYLHDAYVAAYGTTIDATTPAGRWQSLVNETYVKSGGPASALSTGGTACVTPVASRSFIMNPAQTNYALNRYVPTDSYAYVDTDDAGALIDAKGMWIEAVRSPAASEYNGVGYIDFHIRACWPSPGSNVPITLGTIVRLYDKS